MSTRIACNCAPFPGQGEGGIEEEGVIILVEEK